MVDGPSDDPEVNGRNVAGRVTWDINISTVIILLTALGGGMYFVAQARSQTEQAQRDIARLELTIQTGLTALTQQLAGLPFQQAALKNLEERVQESIRWRTQEEDRVNRLRDTVSQAVADLELLKRASSTGVLSAPARSH